MALSKEERIGEIFALRMKIKSDNDLRNQLLSSISDLLKNRGISTDDEIISEITIALPDELNNELSEVILPGGTNC